MIQVTYYNGRRMTSRKFRSPRRLVQFLRSGDVFSVSYIIDTTW